jgi:hypothetical protein
VAEVFHESMGAKMSVDEWTRRGFLAALAAAGGAGALLPGAANAAPVPPPPGGGVFGELPTGASRAEGAPAGRREAYPAPTPGLRYSLVNGGRFFPLDNTIVYGKYPWLFCPVPDLPLIAGGSFGLAFDMLPDGAIIAEVSLLVLKSSTWTGNVEALLFRFLPYEPSLPISLVDTADTTTFAQSESPQNLTLALAGPVAERTIDRSAADHWLVANLGSNVLIEVRIGWVPPAAPLGFYPLAPKRVYDSRRPTGGGPLAAVGARVVSVKDGFINDSDTLDAPDVVPLGAKAIAYNLTIVNTSGAGYLSVGPGDAAAAGGSSINWSAAGQVLANGLTVTIDASRQIKVFAGPGGGTDFLIDVLGYYA